MEAMTSVTKPIHFPMELKKTTEVAPKACPNTNKMKAVMVISFSLSSLEASSVCFSRLENLAEISKIVQGTCVCVFVEPLRISSEESCS